MLDKEMTTAISYKIAEIILRENEENENGITYDPAIPIASILSAHLKVCIKI